LIVAQQEEKPVLEWLVNIPADFWAVLIEMAPYLLFGFFVAGVLSVVVSQEFVERHLGGRGVWPVLKASAFGVPLPLCSCGVIPVSASLRNHGASKGATVGFLISTPQTGVDSIMVTFSLMGGVFAIFRPLTALVSGLIGGTIVSAVDANGSEGARSPSATCRETCCAGGSAHGKIYGAFAYGFGALPRDIARMLLAGLAIAVLISAAVPENYLTGLLGGGIGAMLIMMLLGVPIYVCATASVPIAAALICKGVSPGAALVFLMTGPATNAATITMVWRMLGRRTALVYLLTVALSALAAGLILDYVFSISHIQATPAMGGMLPNYVKWAAAVILLGILGVALFRRPIRRGADQAKDLPQPTRVTIKGMTCSHCAASVRRALLECPGVEAVEVDPAGGEAVVRGSGWDLGALRKAVEELGYTVVKTGEGSCDSGQTNSTDTSGPG
jgi:uncharacterized membrane protein YraQ (UPF0718 family)/copper chaperone CopZ